MISTLLVEMDAVQLALLNQNGNAQDQLEQLQRTLAQISVVMDTMCRKQLLIAMMETL